MSEFRQGWVGAVTQYQAAYAALKGVPLGQPQPSMQRHAEVGGAPLVSSSSITRSDFRSRLSIAPLTLTHCPTPPPPRSPAAPR
jgi:hypothetical protein